MKQTFNTAKSTILPTNVEYYIREANAYIVTTYKQNYGLGTSAKIKRLIFLLFFIMHFSLRLDANSAMDNCRLNKYEVSYLLNNYVKIKELKKAGYDSFICKNKNLAVEEFAFSQMNDTIRFTQGNRNVLYIHDSVSKSLSKIITDVKEFDVDTFFVHSAIYDFKIINNGSVLVSHLDNYEYMDTDPLTYRVFCSGDTVLLNSSFIDTTYSEKINSTLHHNASLEIPIHDGLKIIDTISKRKLNVYDVNFNRDTFFWRKVRLYTVAKHKLRVYITNKNFVEVQIRYKNKLKYTIDNTHIGTVYNIYFYKRRHGINILSKRYEIRPSFMIKKFNFFYTKKTATS